MDFLEIQLEWGGCDSPWFKEHLADIFHYCKDCSPSFPSCWNELLNWVQPMVRCDPSDEGCCGENLTTCLKYLHASGSDADYLQCWEDWEACLNSEYKPDVACMKLKLKPKPPKKGTLPKKGPDRCQICKSVRDGGEAACLEGCEEEFPYWEPGSTATAEQYNSCVNACSLAAQVPTDCAKECYDCPCCDNPDIPNVDADGWPASKFSCLWCCGSLFSIVQQPGDVIAAFNAAQSTKARECARLCCGLTYHPEHEPPFFPSGYKPATCGPIALDPSSAHRHQD